MNITEYQTIIEKTAVYPKEFGAAYTTLGLVGESGELYDTFFVAEDDYVNNQNLIKESGDVCWYITATANEYDIPLNTIFTGGEMPMHYKKGFLGEDFAMEALQLSSKIAELVKKNLRDGKIDKDKLVGLLKDIYFCIRGVAEYAETTFETILETNYNKLIKRRETGTLHGSGDNREENE